MAGKRWRMENSFFKRIQAGLYPQHQGCMVHTLATKSSGCPKREEFLYLLIKSGFTHPHTGSTGSAAGSLVDSCTCMHQLSSDSHADTCGYHHTHPYLSGTNTQQDYCKSLFSGINQLILRLVWIVFRPSQVCALGSNENPRWHSQLKLPGVFWQTPLEPHRLGSVEHSLLSTQRGGKVQTGKTGNMI